MNRTTRRSILVVFILSAIALGSFSGCRCIKRKLGGESIQNPSPNSPEGLVQKVLASGLMDDAEEGYTTFVQLIVPVRRSKSCEDYYRSFRRKADKFVTKGSKRTRPHYKLMDVKSAKPGRDTKGTKRKKLFVKNRDSKSTPFDTVKYKGKWMLNNCSI